MRVETAPRAEADLESIGDYIARDNPVRAETFIVKLTDYIRSLGRVPFKGATRDDLHAGLRMVSYGQYLIFYTVNQEVLRVERVIHTARDLTRSFS